MNSIAHTAGFFYDSAAKASAMEDQAGYTALALTRHSDAGQTAEATACTRAGFPLPAPSARPQPTIEAPGCTGDPLQGPTLVPPPEGDDRGGRASGAATLAPQGALSGPII